VRTVLGQAVGLRSPCDRVASVARARRAACIAALSATILSAPVAKGDDRATAQELFTQGRTLMSAGSFAEACAKFEGAAELSPTAGVRLNLAECYAKLGRTATAWARYEEAVTMALRSGDAAAAAIARARQAELRPVLAFLDVSVSEAAAGTEIVRDGEKVPRAAWGVAVPVDPGEHEIAATAPGRKPWSIKVTVAPAGAPVTVAVPLLAEAADPAVATGTAQDTGVFAGPGRTQRTIAVVAAGLGIVGIGVGSAFGVEMLNKQGDYKQQENQATGKCLNIQCQTLSQDAASAGNAATAALIGGAALASAAVFLWLTAPRTSTLLVVPVAFSRGVGLSLQEPF